MAVVRDPGERGDRGHDEQPQLEPDPGQETPDIQSALQINLVWEEALIESVMF